jgi:uncharacterized membrane protein YbhN (UPF0104 family)
VTITRAPGRGWLPWIVSLAVTAGLLSYLLRGIDARAIRDAALGAAPGPFAAFVSLYLLGVAARATRFWLLLGRTVPFRLVAGITVVRNLFVDLLPARLGELTYVYLVTTRARRPVEDGVATMALAFLLDLVALSPLVLAALVVVGGGVSVPLAVGVSASLAAVGIGAIVFAGPVVGYAADRLGEPRRSGRVQRLAAHLGVLRQSLDRARAQRVLVPAFLLSVVIRLCKYGGTYCLVLSLLLPLGYAVGDLGIFRVFLGSMAAEVAAALPVHGLAGFGTYEAAWSLTLERLGYPREHAVISGLVSHAITQGLEYLLGITALIWLLRPETVRPSGGESPTGLTS